MSIDLINSIEEIFKQNIENHAKVGLVYDLVSEHSASQYKKGYDDGYDVGRSHGYDDGYIDGESALADKSYCEGYEDGFKKGLTKGIEKSLEELDLSQEQTEVIRYLLFKAKRGCFYDSIE